VQSSPSKERIQKYVDALKSEVRKLEACLQGSGTPEQLNTASKAVVLCAALTNETTSRCVYERAGSFEDQVPENIDSTN
jgi:hypothetical protein